MRKRFLRSTKDCTEMKNARRGLGAFVALGVVGFLSLAGCQKKDEGKTVQPVPTQSVVAVKTSSAVITATTPTAEFRFAPSGVLTGSLLGSGANTSLDAQPPESSQVISISKKEHSGIAFDLATAKVREA